jgi:hypothetical protein
VRALVKAINAINIIERNWRKRIAQLTPQKWAETLYSETGEDAFEVNNPGTVMKLLFLWNYMLYPYLYIMASRRAGQRTRNRRAKLFYLDPYAGNGLVKVRVGSESIIIPGSSVLALLAPIMLHETRTPGYPYYWDIMVLNDINDKYRTQLITRYKFILNRLSTLGHLYRIYSELPLTALEDRVVAFTDFECEQQMTWSEFRRFFEIVKGKDGWIHGLIFLDPPSPKEMPLRFLGELLSIPSDVIALVHTGIFADNVNMRRYTPDTLASILNCDIREAELLLQGTHTMEELENLYVQKFRELLQVTTMRDIISGSPTRNFIKPIRLSTGKRHYHLVVATRATGGEKYKEWQNQLEMFAKKVEMLSDLDRLVIDILSGKQAKLNFK